MVNEDEKKEQPQREVKEEKIEVKDAVIVEESTEVGKPVETVEPELATFAQELAKTNPFTSNLPDASASFALIRETAQSLEAMKQVANSLISSQLCPLKKESDVIVAILTGNQYGFPFMTSINNIYPINGKPTMSVHLMRALILKYKIVPQKVYDFEPIFEYAKLNETKDGWAMKEVPNPNGGAPVKVFARTTRGTKDECPEGYAPVKEVDRITKYQFKRQVRLADGSYELLTVTSEFKMSDAAKAELLDKDNWIKHPARMCDARAFSIGSREIGSDFLLGIYSIGELADEFNIRYTVSSSLQEAVIIND